MLRAWRYGSTGYEHKGAAAAAAAAAERGCRGACQALAVMGGALKEGWEYGLLVCITSKGSRPLATEIQSSYDKV